MLSKVPKSSAMATLSNITGISLVPPSLPCHPSITRTSFRPLHVTTSAAVAFSSQLSHRKTRGLPLYPRLLRTSFGLLHVPTPAVFAFYGVLSYRKRRGLEVVTRAAANTSSYVFAVAFPLSLLAVTIFTSIKIADKLDKDFLEDLTINQAIREAGEEDDGDGDGDGGDDDDAISLEEIVQVPVLPRTRNRPKRKV